MGLGISDCWPRLAPRLWHTSQDCFDTKADMSKVEPAERGVLFLERSCNGGIARQRVTDGYLDAIAYLAEKHMWPRPSRWAGALRHLRLERAGLGAKPATERSGLVFPVLHAARNDHVGEAPAAMAHTVVVEDGPQRPERARRMAPRPDHQDRSFAGDRKLRAAVRTERGPSLDAGPEDPTLNRLGLGHGREVEQLVAPVSVRLGHPVPA